MSHANERSISPFSDEHYRAMTAVAADLTAIINRSNTSSYVTKAAMDSLCELTKGLLMLYVPNGTNASHPIDNA